MNKTEFLNSEIHKCIKIKITSNLITQRYQLLRILYTLHPLRPFKMPFI